MEEKVENPRKLTVDRSDPLGFIKRNYLDRAIIGEDRNKQLLFLICCSTFTDNPLSCIVKARSSAGKSWLVNRVLDLFRPLGNVIEASRMTPAYLENMANKNRDPKPIRTKEESDQEYVDRVKAWKSQRRTANLKKQIITIDELKGIQNAQAPKLLISEKRLILRTVDINREPIELEVLGPPTIITTTTQAALEDAEFENRVLSIEVDESQEQTEAILESHAERFANPAEDLAQYARDQAILEFFNSLKHHKVANPFATLIRKEYPSKNIEARRDFPKLLALANVVTWLNQKRRRTAKKGLELFIITDKADIDKVREIGLVALRESLAGYSEKEDTLLEIFKNELGATTGQSGLEESKNPYNYLTVHEAAQKLRKKVRRGEEWTRKHIAKLVEEEFLEEHPDNTPGKKGLKYRYSELQPEILDINTDKYSNEILPTWAKSYGYQLLDKQDEDHLLFPVQREKTNPTPKQLPCADSNAENPPHSEYGTVLSRNQPIGEPNPVNRLPPRSTEKQRVPESLERSDAFEKLSDSLPNALGTVSDTLSDSSNTPGGTSKPHPANVPRTDPLLEEAKRLTLAKGRAHIKDLEKAFPRVSFEELNRRMDDYARTDQVRTMDWGVWEVR